MADEQAKEWKPDYKLEADIVPEPTQVTENRGFDLGTDASPSSPFLINNFIDLLDCPSTYLGQAGLFCKVKATEDGLEFGAGGGGGAAIVPFTLVVAASNSLDTTRADYVCDGTSDQAEIKAALAALPVGGGCVVLLEGTYTIDGSIELISYQQLIGNGSGTIIKAKNSVGSALYMIYNKAAIEVGGVPNSPNYDIFISNLTIDGNSGNNNNTKIVPLSFDNMRGLIVKNCWIKNASSDVSLELGDGIVLSNGAIKNIIVDNVISDCETNGIYIDGTGTGGRGYGNIIERNIITSCGEGMLLTYPYRDTISSNYVCSNVSGGIMCEYGLETSFINNILCGNGEGDGITLGDSSSRCVVIGNQCNSNAGDGISCQGTYNIIKGNIVRYNYLDGILLASSNHNIISENMIYGNGLTEAATYSGIFLTDSDYNNIQSNTIRKGSAQGYGINVSDATSDGNLVTNNDLYDAGSVADLNDSGTGTVTTAGNRT